VPLTNEKSVLQKEIFDETVFKRMKLTYLPPRFDSPTSSEPSPSPMSPPSQGKRKKVTIDLHPLHFATNRSFGATSTHFL
jgi:hypothetical protein